jgi:hypothetical protein
MFDPASNAMAAEAPTRECPKHGLLPLSRFYPEDLQRNRHRCKRCVADQVARWRKSNPQKTLWRRFIQRARRRFGAEAVSGLDWASYGQPLLRKLVSELEDPDGPLLQRYILTWSSPGSLEKLFLCPR